VRETLRKIGLVKHELWAHYEKNVRDHIIISLKNAKDKVNDTKTDPFDERIGKFAMRQGACFEIGMFVLYLRGSREEWEGRGWRGERENRRWRACYNTAYTSDLEVRPLPQRRFGDIFFKRVSF